ncbi:MAG: hypothetical protein M1436_06265 [Acidobacteria bacterium]|nr:hypothetical protein [Acidobacteriota bacterium]
MTRYLLSLAAACMLAQTHVDVGERRQLLMDDRFVRDAKGVSFRVHPPRKTGEIAIPDEQGWALGSYHSVLAEGAVYHMWYTARNAICYARSSDGIHWQRPELNLTALGGQPGRNIVIGYGAGEVKGATHGVMVFLDPNAPAGERFRLVANPHEFGRMLQLFSSPDGIHWKHTHTDILTFDENKRPHHLDTLNVIFWDEAARKYVAYVRRSSLAQGRMVARAESSDLSHFGVIEDTRLVFNADNLNIRHLDPLRKREAPLIDVYTNDVIRYPWADAAYFMFPAMYYHFGAYQNEFRAEAPVNAGVLDVRFAASRDGIAWNTYGWDPFVPNGISGEFDSRRVYMGYGMLPSPNGREIYQYYLGTTEPHGWNRDDRNNRILTAGGAARRPVQRAISRVVSRRDGFVSVRAGSQGGEFTTPPLAFDGNELVLNVDTSALGEVQVEIQDTQGNPLPGFRLSDCDIIHSANEISRPVRWNRASTLEKLTGKTVRLRFVLRNADLYAFQFRQRPAI